MMQTNEYYWYGLSAMFYLATCWMFVAVRCFHTCQTPKERRSYLWPDRELQITIYLMANILIPYIVNPASEEAWLLEKSYFPCTYFFYCGALLLCFFGSVKQWHRWKTAVWIAAFITVCGMMPLVIHAWIPDGLLTDNGVRIWSKVVVAISIIMMGYSGMAMWKVWQWMSGSHNENYSNPDDFPTDYAQLVWLAPVLFIPLVWPAYLLDSPMLMAIMNVLLAISNVILLLIVLPPWRRVTLMPESIEDVPQEDSSDELVAERTNRIAAEIEQFVKTERAYLDPHLKLEHVVDHCSYSRSYVSKVFQDRFNGFSDYVNGLRLEHYETYMKQYPLSTIDTAAQESGFTSSRAYYRAKERLGKRR